MTVFGMPMVMTDNDDDDNAAAADDDGSYDSAVGAHDHDR